MFKKPNSTVLKIKNNIKQASFVATIGTTLVFILIHVSNNFIIDLISLCWKSKVIAPIRIFLQLGTELYPF